MAVALSIVGTTVAPRAAHAAPPEGEEAPAEPTLEEKAMQAYEAGTKAYNDGRYQEALEHFQDAQGFFPSPDFHYNIGQCYEALGKLSQAIDSYKAYIRSDPNDKGNVENKVARLQEKIDAEASKPDPVEPGPVEPAPVEPPPEPVDDGKKPGVALIATGSTLAVLGAAAAGTTGAIFGIQATDRANEIDEINNGNPNDVTIADAKEIDEAGREAQLNQIIGVSVGGAVALTGVALIVVGAIQKKKAASNTARIDPSIGRGWAGVSVSGRF